MSNEKLDAELKKQLSIFKSLDQNNELIKLLKEIIKDDQEIRKYHKIYDICARYIFHVSQGRSRLEELKRALKGGNNG
jgi:hypothetical protein